MTSELIRITAVLAVAAVFALLLRQYRPELGVVLVFAASAAVLIGVLATMEPIVSRINELFERGGINKEYFTVVLKALGIAYITGFVADSCRDFGFASLGAKAELAGKCAVLALSLPLLSEVLSTALELVGV